MYGSNGTSRVKEVVKKRGMRVRTRTRVVPGIISIVIATAACSLTSTTRNSALFHYECSFNPDEIKTLPMNLGSIIHRALVTSAGNEYGISKGGL
jgi:hypothetical protein